MNNEIQRIMEALMLIYGSDLQAATITVLLKDGDTAVRFITQTLPQKETSHDTQRQWVGLTKEEAKEISMANRPYVIDMIAALEARLKEKNT
jgi:hypothetical protein